MVKSRPHRTRYVQEIGRWSARGTTHAHKTAEDEDDNTTTPLLPYQSDITEGNCLNATTGCFLYELISIDFWFNRTSTP